MISCCFKIHTSSVSGIVIFIIIFYYKISGKKDEVMFGFLKKMFAFEDQPCAKKKDIEEVVKCLFISHALS